MRRSRASKTPARSPGSDWIRLAFLVAMLAVLGLAMPYVRDPHSWRMFAPHAAPPPAQSNPPHRGEHPQTDPSPLAKDGAARDATWLLMAGLAVLAALRIAMLVPRVVRPRPARPPAATLSPQEQQVASWLESDESSTAKPAEARDAGSRRQATQDQPKARDEPR